MTAAHDDTTSPTDHQLDLLRIVRSHYPQLAVESVTGSSGQFNDVLILNDELVVRFPRTADAAALLAIETTVLRRLQGHLPLPVPDPEVSAFADDSRRPLLMSYRLLPGNPLNRETLDRLWLEDRPSFERIGRQAGEFLRALHAIPIDDMTGQVPRADNAQFWQQMLDAFRDELFGYVRPEARKAVERQFLDYLGNEGNFVFRPALRHGDFGGANLLVDADARALCGVIDFGAVALGDPASDLAAIAAFDDRLALCMRPAYPELFAPDALQRVAFYRSTFALQQALWAQRAGDDAEFDDGIAAYV